MSEERTEYTAGGKVTPDNAGAAMQLITENYIAQLERTIDGYAMIQGRHADTITEQKRRIAELEADIARKNGALHALDVAVQQQSETIARLEQDNRRLRWLDSMPVDAMRRCHYGSWNYPDWDVDQSEVIAWFEKQPDKVTHE